MKIHIFSVIRVLILALALMSLTLSVPMWVQYALCLLSSMVWGITAALDGTV